MRIHTVHETFVHGNDNDNDNDKRQGQLKDGGWWTIRREEYSGRNLAAEKDGDMDR